MPSTATATGRPTGAAPLGRSCDLPGSALRYAAARIPVMPLHTVRPGGVCSCGAGPDCTSPGKHPRLRHGLSEATTAAALIRRWWQRWPDANIGLATGGVLDVCDIDTSA